jgi:hypothetical protein
MDTKLFPSRERYLMRKFPELADSKVLKLKLKEYKLYRAIENSIKNVLNTGHL